MEQLQADMAAMKVQMETQMAQFMEVITNMNQGQQELRALVERNRSENGRRNPFDDASVGQPRVGANIVDLGVNDHLRGPGAHATGRFPPPPPTPPQEQLFFDDGMQGHRVRGRPRSQGPDFDQNDEAYSVNGSEVDFPADDHRYRLLEERLKAIEGQKLSGLDLSDLGLAPRVRLPPKFKVPVFDKYNGTTCPKTHITAYFRKMAVYTEDKRLLMHFFQESLTGASLEWYMHLERSHIRTWHDLVNAFLLQYQFNIDMAPNRTQLLGLSQKSGQTFKEYAQEWRELAARVQPPMVEREMIDMFTSTLSGHYYIACSTSASFAEMVRYGERIESGLKSGKIQQVEGSSSGAKKAYSGYPNKEKGEASAVYGGRGRAQVNAVTISASQPQTQQAPRQQNQRQQENRSPRRFDVIPMSYSDLFVRLSDLKLVVPRPALAPPPLDKRPRSYDASASCEFHSGTLGHSIENCYAFKCKVQDLIASKAIELEAG